MITAKKISVLFDVPLAFLEDAVELRFWIWMAGYAAALRDQAERADKQAQKATSAQEPSRLTWDPEQNRYLWDGE